MRPTYQFQVQNDCKTCPWRKQRFFCSVAGKALTQLQRIALLKIEPAGKVLYAEGCEAEGVYILCNGRAKISTASESGRMIILKIALAGEVLGLEASLTNRPHRQTAELLDASQVKFIPREQLVSYFGANAEAALKVVLQMNVNYDSALKQIQRIGFSSSGTQKVAQLLLQWARESSCGRAQPSFAVLYTHEEIAQMIGTTRETVSRALAKFRRSQTIQIDGSTITVRDVRQLAEFAERQTTTNPEMDYSGIARASLGHQSEFTSLPISRDSSLHR